MEYGLRGMEDEGMSKLIALPSSILHLPYNPITITYKSLSLPPSPPKCVNDTHI